MAVDKSQYLLVGQLGKPHGLKGGIRVSPFTNYPETSFAPGITLYLGDDKGNLPSNPKAIRLDAARPFQAGLLVNLEGVFDRSMAGTLTGSHLFLSADQAAELQEGEYFWHDLVGMEVFDLKGEFLGEVCGVHELAPVDLLEVSGPESSFMIPCTSEIVVTVSLDKKRIVLDPPDGLLDL
jgi:16S rRNA processing protein RimM